MELVLNLAWVLLALPAYWLWQRRSGIGRERKFSPLQCLLALSCLLVVLFPVISATDDLHAMRAEIEESGPSKRTVRHAGNQSASPWNSGSQNPPAILTAAFCFPVQGEGWQEIRSASLLVWAAPSLRIAGRSPPSSYLA
jgi:hypothetical protein